MILVSGATGNVGSELVCEVAAQGVPVRALTRRAPEGPGHWPNGVEVAIGNLDDAASLRGALDGVRGLFLLSGYAGTGELLAAGRDAGLERVVMLGSGAVTDADLGADEPSTNAVVVYNVEAERAVRASGLAWTILRPGGFHSNALRWLPQLETGDVIHGPWADLPIASIDPADISAVAAIALTTGDFEGRALRLTGPDALRPAERVEILAEVLDCPLRFEPQDDDAARAEMLADGVPPGYVDAFFRFFSNGETDETTVSPTVEEVTGRPPRTFRQWATAHVGDFL